VWSDVPVPQDVGSIGTPTLWIDRASELLLQKTTRLERSVSTPSPANIAAAPRVR